VGFLSRKNGGIGDRRLHHLWKKLKFNHLLTGGRTGSTTAHYDDTGATVPGRLCRTTIRGVTLLRVLAQEPGRVESLSTGTTVPGRSYRTETGGSEENGRLHLLEEDHRWRFNRVNRINRFNRVYRIIGGSSRVNRINRGGNIPNTVEVLAGDRYSSSLALPLRPIDSGRKDWDFP
jgi:hypothetical protein